MENTLRQKLADARLMRDKVVTAPRRNFISFSYQVVQAQSVVDAAKRELYTWLRKNGHNVAHKDL